MSLRERVDRFATTLACVWAVAGLLGCASSGPPVPELVALDPIRMPGAQLDRSIQRLCLDSLESEIEIADPAQRLSAFEERIVHRLESEGFQVVGSKETGRVRAEIEGELDEAFDPHTGRAISDVARANAARVRERQVEQLDCEAFVEVELVVVQAFWGDRIVVWDGRRVWADGREDLDQLGIALRDAYIGGVRGWGAIPALSLQLAVRDREDRMIFWRAGGIQPIATLRSVPYQIRWDPLPDDRILTDAESNQAAVDLAVGPLRALSRAGGTDCVDGDGGRSDREGAARSGSSTSDRSECAHEQTTK
jgi:hypothetical protein